MDITGILYPILVLGVLGLIFGLVLGYASKKFEVKVDPKIKEIQSVLPGANCGACGYAGCAACAEAIFNGEADAAACVVGGGKVSTAIKGIMGVADGGDSDSADEGPKRAFVKCQGTCDKAGKKANYYGEMDCKQASVVPGGGDKACSYGCLGLGSCVAACNFDAIHIVNGIAQVDPEACIGCGACAEACPRGIIDLMPVSNTVRVACNSKDTLKAVKDVCSIGCMTCRLCARVCEEEAITFENNLPVVDYSKCKKCLKCVEKCPTKALIAYNGKLCINEKVC